MDPLARKANPPRLRLALALLLTIVGVSRLF